MPYLKIQTNATVEGEKGKELLSEASALVSQELGKPEEFFMGAFEPQQTMVFGGTDAPLAFVELKALGLPGEKTKVLCAALCELVEAKLGVPRERVYVKFLDVNRGMWGWSGDMF